MIDQALIDTCEAHLEMGDYLQNELATELLLSYKSLIEQNAELHKELAKLKADRVLVVNKEKSCDFDPMGW